MRVIPVLDLRAGIAVHARRGERARYAPLASCLAADARGDAVRIAGAYRAIHGLEEIYVADLDAIAGGAVQADVVRALAAGARAWVDAGVTGAEAARVIAELGVQRVIVGLETLASRGALREIVSVLGSERVAFSVDLDGGRARAVDPSLGALTAPELARFGADEGVGAVIVLDLSRVGTGAGVDHDLAEHLVRARAPSGPELVVGGGISGVEEISWLAAAGVDGVLVASALHDGRIGAADIASLNTV